MQTGIWQMQPPFQLYECCWALGKVGRGVSHSQSSPFQCSGPHSHLLFFMGCSPLISHLHSQDAKDAEKERGCLALAQKQLSCGTLGKDYSACWSSQCFWTPESKGLNPGAQQFPKYHFPSHRPTGLLHLHRGLQGRQLQKACTEDAFLRWLRDRREDTAGFTL